MKTILETLSGSGLYGTSVDPNEVDLDLTAIGIEPPADSIGFVDRDTLTYRTKPDGVRSGPGDIDFVQYGLRKYLRLTMNGNPTLVLSLFAPKHCIRQITPEGQELISLRDKIVSKKFHASFLGYMKEQHERLKGERGQKNIVRPELVEMYGFDTKYAAHIIRLGCQGIELMTTGHVTLPMPKEERDLVLGIRTGKYTLPQVNSLIEEVENNLKATYNTSSLPQTPDYASMQNWMISKYLENWNVK